VPLVEPKEEAFNSHNSIQPQFYLQQFIDFDQILLNASGMIGDARKAFYNYKIALDIFIK
jgi:hypothetical protein